MRQSYYLYQITLGGLSYIGATNCPRRRMATHRRATTPIGLAIKKLGWSSAIVKILAIGPRDYIHELEIKAIQRFNTLKPNGYNVRLNWLPPTIIVPIYFCRKKYHGRTDQYGNPLARALL